LMILSLRIWVCQLSILLFRFRFNDYEESHSPSCASELVGFVYQPIE
jgi:hypothetical protein